MKRHLFLLIIAALFSATSVFAQGGTTGPLTWNLSGGTLTISVTDGGTGAMPDYADWYDPDSAPWQEYEASIHTAIMESGVTSIGNYAFSMCTNLASVTIPNSVTTIRESAFCYCFSLTSVTIPNSITTIGRWAFCYTHLTSITIPNSVMTIGFAAFDQCSSLTTITISSSVTTIEDYAFNECTSLTSVTNLNLVPIEISSNVFSSVNQNACTLTVPTSAVSSYQNTGVWQEFNIVGGGFLVNPVSSNNERGYATGNGLYEGGKSTATLTAVAYIGSKFVNWEINGEVVSTANPYIFTVTEDVKLVANFEAETYLVTINVNNDEYGTATGAGMYEYNTTATVTATANNGYKFLNWTKNGAEISIDNPYSFIVTEDVELVANFEEVETYLVIVNANNDEYGTAIGDGIYEENEIATVTATANDGYKFINWTKDGVEVSTDNPFSFTVTEDIELIANFIDDVGIENIEVAAVKIYPNPTKGELKIESGELRVENLVIYDVFGKIQRIENWKTENTIDISHLSAGIYFVKISTEAGEVTRKVLKE